MRVEYLKRGWNRKERRGNKDFKKGGKMGQGVGTLKKGGLEPLYELCTALKRVRTNQCVYLI